MANPASCTQLNINQSASAFAATFFLRVEDALEVSDEERFRPCNNAQLAVNSHKSTGNLRCSVKGQCQEIFGPLFYLL